MTGSDPVEALTALVRAHGASVPLDRGLIAIARVERPNLDAPKVQTELDRLAARARARAASSVDGGLEAVRKVLFDEAGFRGNRDGYYEPDNSLIDRVLERRLGIPITLATVWLEVARRAGLRAEGIGFPGHFLVRHLDVDVWRYVDVFDGGRILEPGDPERLLRSVHGEAARLDPSMLDPVSPKNLLIRICNNLKNAYALRKDHLGVVRAIDRLLALDPSLFSERRDRGLVYARLCLAQAALSDLRAYIAEGVVSAPERAALERMIPDLEARAARMN